MLPFPLVPPMSTPRSFRSGLPSARRSARVRDSPSRIPNRPRDCSRARISPYASSRSPVIASRQITHAPRPLFTITEGVVRLYKLLVDGRRQLLGFALPGDFLGLSLFDIYSFSADAVTDTVVCRFPRKAFIAYAEQRPHLLRRLHEFASHELSLAQDQMVLLGRRSAEQRVAAFLVMMRDRLQRLGHTSPTLPLPMSRQDIADYLGLTIETVSRTFSKLAAGKSIVIVPDGVRLLRQRELEQLATG